MIIVNFSFSDSIDNPENYYLLDILVTFKDEYGDAVDITEDVGLLSRYININELNTNFYDDSDMQTPSTELSDDYYIMTKEETGVYRIYLRIDNLENNDIGQLSLIYEYSTVTYHLNKFFEIGLDSVNISDNDYNKNMIAKAIKEYDASGITTTVGSIAENIDKTIDIEDILLALGINKMRKDYPNIGDVTYYKSDGTTPYYTIRVDATGRTFVEWF